VPVEPGSALSAFHKLNSTVPLVASVCLGSAGRWMPMYPPSDEALQCHCDAQ
jgi:hypothetical protein